MATTISPAISIRYLQEIFGLSDTDLGTLMKKIVDNRNLINIWAKYKPIYHPGVGLLTNAMRQDNSHTVSGYTISWGIMKPTSYNWTDYIDTTTGEVRSGLWGYDKPVGGIASPWRLSDFAGIDNNGNAIGDSYRYSSSAKCPIAITLPQGDTLPVPYSANQEGSTLMFIFTFQNGVTGWSATHSLSIDEIFAAEKSYYPTVVLTCYYNGRVYEYSKSGDNPVSYYTGNVNPVVQVPINTKTLAEAVCNDGGYYHTGALAKNAVWTACMVLTSQKIAGGVTTHVISNAAITRLEYETGVDRKQLTVVTTSALDEITALSYTVTLKRSESGSFYYIQSIMVTIRTTWGSPLSFSVDAAFTCLIGVIGGTGWAGTNQSEYVDGWGSLYISTNERERTITKELSKSTSYPEYRFTGDIYTGQRIAAGSLSFTSGGLYISGSFSFNVAGGDNTYTQTVTII